MRVISGDTMLIYRQSWQSCFARGQSEKYYTFCIIYSGSTAPQHRWVGQGGLPLASRPQRGAEPTRHEMTVSTTAIRTAAWDRRRRGAQKGDARNVGRLCHSPCDRAAGCTAASMNATQSRPFGPPTSRTTRWSPGFMAPTSTSLLGKIAMTRFLM